MEEVFRMIPSIKIENMRRDPENIQVERYTLELQSDTVLIMNMLDDWNWMQTEPKLYFWSLHHYTVWMIDIKEQQQKTFKKETMKYFVEDASR